VSRLIRPREGCLLNVLVINSGSSSVKYELFAMGADAEHSMLNGEVERIGSPEASLWQEVRTEDGATYRDCRDVRASDHSEALDCVLEALDGAADATGAGPLQAVGHRVVHGGERFADPVVLDGDAIAAIERLALLAPLHTGANLAGIEAARIHLPDVPHVAVFDTAFHRTMPAHACVYALPRELCREHGIRRYGFHGTSHAYVAKRAAAFLGRPLEELALITLHLGAGASATAIRGGESVDTSMGMTPLEGLMMGTRCGDVDPAVPMLLARLTGRSREDVHRLLNNESGLLGVCGAGDMREVHRLAEEGDADAALALEMFCYRVKKYVGAYVAALGGADAIVFTAGIGENDAEVRSRVCGGLDVLGIEIDEARNRAKVGGERRISSDASRVAVLVIPTDEELEIARRTVECVNASSP